MRFLVEQVTLNYGKGGSISNPDVREALSQAGKNSHVSRVSIEAREYHTRERLVIKLSKAPQDDWYADFEVRGTPPPPPQHQETALLVMVTLTCVFFLLAGAALFGLPITPLLLLLLALLSCGGVVVLRLFEHSTSP